MDNSKNRHIIYFNFMDIFHLNYPIEASVEFILLTISNQPVGRVDIQSYVTE